LPEAELVEAVAARLAEGKVVGWFQGRMEYGPRALGSRSILGDPRVRDMQSRMNLKIKQRESFRPFAPAVLSERCEDYFELGAESPYMLLVAPVRQGRRVPETPEQERLFGIERLNQPRSDIPAVTHVDYSARVQTVERGDHPLFHALLSEFDRRTGCAVLVNTSFNLRGEPIVCRPKEAYACFMRTGIDSLAMGGFLLDKEEQAEWKEEGDWRKVFALD
jgi:carbamoyltransferase